jgi:hypothetical protein
MRWAGSRWRRRAARFSLMRRFVLMVLLTALAACDSGAAAQRETAPPAVHGAVTGLFKASSDAARHATGDIELQRAGIMFANGVVLYTRTLEPRRGSDLISRSGDSYAAIAVRPAEVAVELRRVTEQVAPQDGGLCGRQRPHYVALLFDERATLLTVLVFAGEEPPGPDASGSRLCAALAYVAPSGARTQQGVVL